MKEHLARSALTAVSRLCHVTRRIPAIHEPMVKASQRHLGWRGFAINARTRWGGVFACDPEDAIQYRLCYYGIWEPNLTAYFQKTLRPGAVFVDVGANIGYFSILASRIGGDVVAIEASPTIAALLRENIQRNKARVRVVEKAASDKTGTVTVYAASRQNIGHTNIVGDGTPSGTVPCAPLDEILTADERRRAEVIKIDVEGAEAPILGRFLDTADRYPSCRIVIAELEATSNPIIERFRAGGWSPYMLENDYQDDAPYLNGAAKAPFPLHAPISQQTDVLFVR